MWSGSRWETWILRITTAGLTGVLTWLITPTAKAQHNRAIQVAAFLAEVMTFAPAQTKRTIRTNCIPGLFRLDTENGDPFAFEMCPELGLCPDRRHSGQNRGRKPVHTQGRPNRGLETSCRSTDRN